MLSRILPKKTEFFGLFSKHAALCVEGAGLLRDLLRDPSQAEEGYRRIHAVEHQADRICQETMEMLHSSFITPIDRSDIVQIVDLTSLHSQIQGPRDRGTKGQSGERAGSVRSPSVSPLPLIPLPVWPLAHLAIGVISETLA